MSTETKSEQVHLRISKTEKQTIAYNASLMNISISEYILLCVRRKRIVVCENFPDLIYEMSRIGNNINQIAAIANTNNYISEKSVDEAKQLLRECRGEMNNFISFIVEPEQEFKNEGDIRLADIMNEINNSLKSINLRLNKLDRFKF